MPPGVTILPDGLPGRGHDPDRILVPGLIAVNHSVWMAFAQRGAAMNASDKTLEVKIQSTRGTRDFSFPKETKVAEAIAAAVTAFGFAPGDRFELVLATNPGEPLQPERPLVSYHITDGTVLVLTAVGGGV